MRRPATPCSRPPSLECSACSPHPAPGISDAARPKEQVLCWRLLPHVWLRSQPGSSLPGGSGWRICGSGWRTCGSGCLDTSGIASARYQARWSIPQFWPNLGPPEVLERSYASAPASLSCRRDFHPEAMSKCISNSGHLEQKKLQFRLWVLSWILTERERAIDDLLVGSLVPEGICVLRTEACVDKDPRDNSAAGGSQVSLM